MAALSPPTQDTGHETVSYLLKLPPELRVLIYESLCTRSSRTMQLVRLFDRNSGGFGWRYHGLGHQREKNATSLLLTWRQIYLEPQSLVGASTKLTILSDNRDRDGFRSWPPVNGVLAECTPVMSCVDVHVFPRYYDKSGRLEEWK